MKRSVIIVGNGLGMAINPDLFDLKNVANKAMSDEKYKLEDNKLELIKACLPKDSSENSIFDFSEKNMIKLQEILYCCQKINTFESARCIDGWLNDDGKKFYDYVREFNFNVAGYLADESSNYVNSANLDQFFENLTLNGVPLGCGDKHKKCSESFQKGDFGSFCNNLADYIENTKSHVATLNYDTILYNLFVHKKILDGYNLMIDGICNSGFDKGNINRHYPNNQCFYLHLHGSPLYYEDNDIIKKHDRSSFSDINFNNLETENKICGKHIVLAPAEHKASIINNSTILLEYWHRLAEALQEVDNVVIFGCSGQDNHLNRFLGKYYSKEYTVVEWNGSDNDEKFWLKSLGILENEKDRLNYKPLDSILEFNFMDLLTK